MIKDLLICHKYFATNQLSVAPSQAQKVSELLEVESDDAVSKGVVTWLVSGLCIEESQFSLFFVDD